MVLAILKARLCGVSKSICGKSRAGARPNVHNRPLLRSENLGPITTNLGSHNISHNATDNRLRAPQRAKRSSSCTNLIVWRNPSLREIRGFQPSSSCIFWQRKA